MAVANARLTLGTVLGTVGVAASGITTTITTGVKLVDTADVYISNLLVRTQKRAKVDMHMFESALQEEKAQELAERRRNVLDYCAQSESHKVMYETAYSEIEAALKAA